MVCDVYERMLETIQAHALVQATSPVVVMISGGSDSTALVHLVKKLYEEGHIGAFALLHVNHQLRGEESDADEAFVIELAQSLALELKCVSFDVEAISDAEGENIEAVARRVRYQAAHDYLASLCQREAVPVSEGRIFVAHTADDRVENFYMRSIVGTGPGGFRSMRYLNGQVARPLLDISRTQLRDYLLALQNYQDMSVRTETGALWCEDSTNEYIDRFRAFVRHEIIPLAKKRNPQLLETLTRTMNAIGDEDDYLESQAASLAKESISWLDVSMEACLLSPSFAQAPLVLQRRVVVDLLKTLLGADARIERRSIDAVLAGFKDGKPRGGYVANIQGNIAISANKEGVRIEPMAVFRIRRNRFEVNDKENDG